MKTSISLNVKTGALILAVAFTCFVFNVKGQNIEWQGATADYNTPVNWVGGVVPGSTNNAINSNGSNNVVQINIGDPDWTLTDISAAGDPLSSGAIEQNGQNLNLNGWLHIGAGSNSFGIYTLNGGTVNVTNGGQLFLGEGPGSTSILNINGGTINSSDLFHIADGGWNGDFPRTGTVTQVSGTVNTSPANQGSGNGIWLGEFTGGTGIYNLQGGTINSSNYFAVGRSGGSGTLNMTGGTINHTPPTDEAFVVGDYQGTGGTVGTFNFSGGSVNCTGAEFWIGNGGSSSSSGAAIGTNNISGTAALTVNTWIAVGRGGTGFLNISGGSVTKTGPNNITIGANVSGNGLGTVNQTGGVVTNTTSQTWIGESGTGTWNMNGGMAYLGQVIIGEDGGANGTLNLNSGTFQASSIGTGSSTAVSILNFNGGTLQANINNGSFLSGLTLALVGTGGATVDSQDYDITIPQEIDDNGGGQFIKNGVGTLTLTGPNTYAGDTIVNEGTLIVATGSQASGNYVIADNAGFGVSVQSAGAQLNAQQNFTVGNTVGAFLDFNLGSFGNPNVAPLNVSGGFTINGTITVNIADGLPQLGEFPLIQFPNGGIAGLGGFVIGSLPTGVAGTIVTNGNTIALDITAVNLPRWEGLAGGNWDIGLTTNWINFGTGLPTYYGEGNAVLFNDSALGTTNVNITTTVNPGSVTINNNILNYTFTGSGQINGPTGLNKQGSGTLAILNMGGNGYTGPTVISGGTLDVTNLANGGSPSALGASSANPTNLVLAGGTLSYQGSPVIINRGYDLTGNSVIDAEGNLTLSGLAQAPSGTLFKIGPGTLTYAGVGTNVLSPANNAGAFQVQNGTVIFDGSGGAQTNYVIGQWFVGSTTNTAANLILTNTSFGSSDWFAVGRGNGASNFVSTASLYNSELSVSYSDASGGISLGYNNGLTNSAYQAINLYGNSALVNAANGGNFNIAESKGSTAIVTVTNGASITSANTTVRVGYQGIGILNLNSTSTSALATTGGTLLIGGNGGSGDTGMGAFNQTSGTLLYGTGGGGAYITLGDNGGSSSTTYGSYSLSGGTISETTGDGFRIGYGGLGSFAQSGGTFLCGRYLSIGGNGSPAGTGVATFTGGTASIFNTSYRVLLPDAANCTGTFNLGTEAGGTAIFTNLYNSGGNSFIMESSSGGNGTLNLNSGTLQLGGAVHRNNSSGGSAVANLNGGTLQAGANNITLIDTSLSSANVFKSGLTIDTMGNNVTVSGNLLAALGNGIYPAGGAFVISTNGGAGYIGPPLVTVNGGSGSGAMAIVTVSGGVITNVIMTCPGQNYQAGDMLTFAFAGGGATTVASNFVYTLQAGDITANAGGSLTKLGSGTLNLTGSGTYTGSTLVDNGTLFGAGSVSSPVSVASGATLGVGSSTAIGTFTVNNIVTFPAGSTNFMKVNKTGGTKDLITGMTQINYGGTLIVSNQAGTYAVGDSFKLYNATIYNGAFSAIVPATPGAGLVWNTSQLTSSGTLIVGTSVNTNPTNITFNVSAGNLNLSWPSDHLGWRLQVQTNALTTGLSTNWATWPNSTNVTSESIPLTTTNPCVFFRLVYP